MMQSDISIAGAFLAGLLSFLSPCVLPLIPSYLTYITGLSFHELDDELPVTKVRVHAALHSLAFICGFSLVFILLGASATFLGSFLQTHMDAIRTIGGVVVIFLGIHISGVFSLRFLLGEKRLAIADKPAGFAGSALVGVAFAAGWTPCIGPILASILVVAATEETVSKGILLLTFYSLGLGVPFFLAALALNRFLSFFNRYKKYIRVTERITGGFLVLVGILLISNYFSVLARLASRFSGGF